MSSTNTIILYVSDAPESGRYLARVLGQEPVEASPGFVLFALPSGLCIGLWGRAGVAPEPGAGGSGCEIGFKVESAEDVDRWYADWRGRGAEILMPPTDLGFGRSFVATDPDGHRLRVYAVAPEV
jgi:predicted enzyme related to lactoylglutathione lyase